MAKEKLFGKSLILGIVVLFFGASVIPGISGSFGRIGIKDMENDVISTNSITAKTGMTIYVDDDNTAGPWEGTQENPYQYIQDGIDNATDGDTVFVYSGNYSGRYGFTDIIVEKSINLIGENKDTTFINGFYDVAYGAILIAANYVNITGFTIQNGYGEFYFYAAGVSVRWSNYTNISGNNIIDCKNGIDAYHSPYIIISGNTIEESDLYTISLRGSYGSRISENIIINNFGGLIMPGYENKPKNIISKNTFANNSFGINLDQSFNNTIYDNNITENTYGIILTDDSDNNAIYHNNFINNTNNSIDDSDGINNFWYNSAFHRGNYWSDYTGEDNARPYGIGDIPYNISGGTNQDMYPLMTPWNGTMPKPLCGDVNADGVVSIADVVYLINYLFTGGFMPIPGWCIGDCNGDGQVTISDVVYLINYLFRGGPPPVEDCWEPCWPWPY